MNYFSSPTPESRRLLGILGVMVGLAASPASADAAERAATLEAIRSLENPRNLPRPGPRGELGAYQFRYDTWRMHTIIPFPRAIERELSDEVAVRHYEWIKRGLEKSRLPVTPYNVALAWNSGLSAVQKGRAPRTAHRYAERASNLAAVLREEKAIAMQR